MTIPSHAATVPIVVPFHDCDLMGVVWHGRYFEYFEIARTKLMQSVSLDVEDLRSLGLAMYVVDTRCRWMHPIKYGEDITCTAWFTGKEPLLRIAFEVLNGDTVRCARATMVFAMVDSDGRLLSTIPSEISEKLPYAK